MNMLRFVEDMPQEDWDKMIKVLQDIEDEGTEVFASEYDRYSEEDKRRFGIQGLMIHQMLSNMKFVKKLLGKRDER